MASNKCKVDLTHPVTGYGKQNKDEKIIVKITDRVHACVDLSTDKYVGITNGSFRTFNPLKRPDDQLNCNPDFCNTTGTLYVSPHSTGPFVNRVGSKYQVYSNALAYTPQGIVSIYLWLPKNGTYNLEMIISDVTDPDANNAYTINKTVNVTNGANFYLVMFELDDVLSTGQIGTGWTPSQKGVTLDFTVEFVPKPNTSETLGEDVGFSTLAIFDSKTELQKNAAVVLSCITSFQDDQSVDATDASCLDGGYNPDTLAVSKSITASTMTQNSFWLNPLEHKTDNIDGFFPVTVKSEVLPYKWNGDDYGVIYITDIAPDNCGWVTVSSDNKCEQVFQATYASHAIKLDDTEFIELKGNFNAVNNGAVLVSKSYVGQSLLVTYPRSITVEEYVADDSRLEGWHAEIQVPVKRKDHKYELRTYRNIYITSITQTFNNTDETAVTISFNAYRDENKRFYTKWVVADSVIK